MWEFYLALVNLLALASWAVLILLPRKPVLLAFALYCGVGILCLLYAVAFGAVLAGVTAPGGDVTNAGFFSIDGIRAMFETDAGVAIGWSHYLAFDLFIGIWIVKDAEAKGFSRLAQAPVLLLTLLAGPAGLLLWLVVREKRARRQGRMT
ncbi:hypothetical protein MB02_14840 [Croceicoccus estronivorus]|uniref:abscisic acid-deficient protein Aba4 family protein n=1 Tax=Croceicoccus estronivorus TaxID=1172626 RepID=UPI000830DD98|nr:abscisic acid-deficient protein Aba4 family protein [Croceicoccus estronivorus]OCC22701.1 hypothetical protein MB02_14840 [Croceicoccus estronivorus]